MFKKQQFPDIVFKEITDFDGLLVHYSSLHTVEPIGLYYFMTTFPSNDTSLDCHSLNFMLLGFQNKAPLGKTSFGALYGNQYNQITLLLLKQQTRLFHQRKKLMEVHPVTQIFTQTWNF